MKSKKVIIIAIIILLIFIIVCAFFYKKIDNTENIDKNLSEIENQESDIIKEIKQESGMTAKEEMYEVEVEYDGNKVLNIKPEIQYKIAFAGIIKQEIPKLEEIDSVFEAEYPKSAGIWIDITSRAKFLELLKENTNNKYEITNDGFLKILEESNPNDDDNALKQMIEGKQKYIVTISGTYYEADRVTGEILDNFFEDIDPYQASKIVENTGNVIIFLSTNKENKLTSKEILRELTSKTIENP